MLNPFRRRQENKRKPVARIYSSDQGRWSPNNDPGYNPLVDPLNPLSPYYVGNVASVDTTYRPPEHTRQESSGGSDYVGSGGDFDSAPSSSNSGDSSSSSDGGSSGGDSGGGSSGCD
jgi:hypothetical protein